MIGRGRALDELAAGRFDVLVIGGGITGAGVALDAASRGYSVALVERADWASGTSSRSSKLVHGGLRYLQRFDLGLVREALLERSLMVRNAPHLVRPLPMVVPAFAGQRPDRLIGIGLNMYDVMSAPGLRARVAARRAPDADAWSPERHRLIDGAEVLALAPALAEREPTGGYLFFDCQTDDARLVLTVIGEAERLGAVCANRLDALAVVPGGARVRDAVSGEEFGLAAANVVNATGVWADRISPGELHDEADVPRIRPSRGTHIVLPRERLPIEAGVIVPAGDGRSIFALPWLGQTLIGTTDTLHTGAIDRVHPAEEDIEYLLGTAGRFFATEIAREEIAGAFAGVRPLVSSSEDRKSVDISRKAELYETSSGLLTITGGKLTTWRRMAKQVVDRIVERDGRRAPCRTDEIALGRPAQAEELSAVDGVGETARRRLAGRYGADAEHVLRLAAGAPELAEPIVPGQPDLLAEAVHAVRHEQALTLGDILLRRTRLGLLAARALCDPESEAVRRVGEVVAAEAGWSAQRLEAERGGFAAEAEAEGLAPSPVAA